MKRHAVMMLCYNNLKLTRDALASVFMQDIGPLDVHVVSNGSNDGTFEWLCAVQELLSTGDNTLAITHYPVNESPVKIANIVMHEFFCRHDKVLGVANDVILPPNFYRLAADCPRGIVCASQTDKKELPHFETASAVNECTPMAIMLTRKWVYDALLAKDGYFFDEGYFHYASDCDLALRMAACGIRGVQLDVQYWHHGSASWRLSHPNEQRKANERADLDRAYFVKKWGFSVNAFEYGQCAVDINWRAIPK